MGDMTQCAIDDLIPFVADNVYGGFTGGYITFTGGYGGSLAWPITSILSKSKYKCLLTPQGQRVFCTTYFPPATLQIRKEDNNELVISWKNVDQNEDWKDPLIDWLRSIGARWDGSQKVITDYQKYNITPFFFNDFHDSLDYRKMNPSIDCEEDFKKFTSV